MSTPAPTTGPVDFWTLDRVAEALGDAVRGAVPRGSDEFLCGVSTDTRAVKSGDLFVALKGERFDAHDFLATAVEQGAAALVVSDITRAAGLGVPAYEVDDTLVALGRLGRYWRRTWGGTVVGVAGSNGKTSTKELLKAALGATRTVSATVGNLNNLVGVPLTLLAIPASTEIAIVEMGTNTPGEIATLRAIVEPDVTVMTSIGEEHLEGLGDLAGVLREESYAFDGVALAVVPANQPEIGEAAKGRAQRVVSAGLDAGDVRADRWSISPSGAGKIVIDGVDVLPPVRGEHNLRNTMLALAVARALGIAFEDAARGIASMPQPSMRSAWSQVGRVTLINDAYNANPGSTRAALDLLASAGAGRQRVAVLGTMRELGAHGDRLHDELARRALDAGIEIVAGVGEFAHAFARVAPVDPRVVTTSDVPALWPLLEPRLEPDAVVLLKASRGVALERILPALEAWAQSSPTG